MKLADMKVTAAEKKAREEAMNKPLGSMGDEEYPWSLRFTLDKDQLDKLGLDTLPAAGTELKIEGVAKVLESKTIDREGDDNTQSLELQVVKLGCELAKAPKTAAQSLYGAGEPDGDEG